MQTCFHSCRLGFAFVVLNSLMVPLCGVDCSAEAATHQQRLHMKQVRLYDSQGFERPIVARTFLMPADWQVAGGVQWNGSLDPNQPAYYESFSAVSPDGQVSFEMLPAYSWIWLLDPYLRQIMLQSGQGSRLAPPLNAAGVIEEYIIPNYRSGARVLTVRSRPDLAVTLRRQLESLGLQQLEANGCRVTLDFIEAQIAYSHNGVRYLESVVVQLFRSDFPSSGMQSFTASNLFLFKSPESDWQQNQLIYATAMRSMRQNPAWLKAINHFQKNIARMRLEGAIRRQQIMSQMYAEMRQSQQESWQYQQESVDRVAREFSEAIRDVETYHDPDTGFDVELPNHYNYAFSNGLGDYVVTNDPLYHPNRDLFESNWRPLQTVR